MIGTREDRNDIPCVSLVEMIASMQDKRGTLLAEWLINVPSGIDTTVVEAEIIQMTQESDPTLMGDGRVKILFRLACPVEDAEIIETMKAMHEQEELFGDEDEDEDESPSLAHSKMMH